MALPCVSPWEPSEPSGAPEALYHATLLASSSHMEARQATPSGDTHSARAQFTTRRVAEPNVAPSQEVV